jgi:hypothetical protein
MLTQSRQDREKVYGRCYRQVAVFSGGANAYGKHVPLASLRESRRDQGRRGEMMPKTMDPEDVELLKLIADGTTHFRPVQDEPSNSPRWVGQVERLLRLRSQGLIRMPEPEKYDDRPGYAAGAGPCKLTADGRAALGRLDA